MSRLMEYEVREVYPCVHDSHVDIERVELQGVEKHSYPDYRACDREASMESDREEEWGHRWYSILFYHFSII